MEHFEDIGPSVVMASPGMMQSGLSRELFESWCTDKRNGCIIAGYCVEGTLAKVCAAVSSHCSFTSFFSFSTSYRNLKKLSQCPGRSCL
jgi:Cft2 family RNA processing exonuclease